MPMRVIYDPQIPGEAAGWLTKADLSELVPFSADQETLDAARRVPSGSRAVFWTFGAGVFWFAMVICLVLPHGSVGGAIFLALFALVISAYAGETWHDLKTGRRRALLRKYHRRYVDPGADLDTEASQVWSRTVMAASTIAGSEVVREQLVDSVRVSVVLPDWLWEIAEKLALLSEVRAGQREALFGQDSSAPEVAVILDQQRRMQDIAAADIERKIRQLEVLAARVAEADTAVQKVQAERQRVQAERQRVQAIRQTVRELSALNDSHADLLARVDHFEAADAHEAELLSHDLQAVIALADEAVRQANEAASGLALR
jgi:hypothetical protein